MIVTAEGLQPLEEGVVLQQAQEVFTNALVTLASTPCGKTPKTCDQYYCKRYQRCEEMAKGMSTTTQLDAQPLTVFA